MGETTASHLSFYSTLAEVVSAAFGGEESNSGSSKGPITEDLSQAPVEHFQARFAQMMSM